MNQKLALDERTEERQRSSIGRGESLLAKITGSTNLRAITTARFRSRERSDWFCHGECLCYEGVDPFTPLSLRLKKSYIFKGTEMESKGEKTEVKVRSMAEA